VPRIFSAGTSAATAGSGTNQSPRPSGVVHRSSQASTAVAAIWTSPLSRLCSACHLKREARMREPEIVRPGASAISPNAKRAVANQYPTVVSVGEATPRADIPVEAIQSPGSAHHCSSRHEWPPMPHGCPDSLDKLLLESYHCFQSLVGRKQPWLAT
jgi:hypothetical protein